MRSKDTLELSARSQVLDPRDDPQNPWDPAPIRRDPSYTPLNPSPPGPPNPPPVNPNPHPPDKPTTPEPRGPSSSPDKDK